MQDSDHSIDWKSIFFVIQIVALCFVIGFGGNFGVKYVLSYFPQRDSPEPLVQQLATSTPEVVEVPIYSSTTPQRVINSLTIADAVPETGKFIAADLVHMKLYLYENGSSTAEYTIKTKGRPGTPWETPSGFYSIQTKEENHFSSIGKVYMPYSMQFYGNYFIHGWTYYPDGTPTAATFSGGCIKLSTEDAEKVFAFAERGTKVFVYDSAQTTPPPPLTVNILPKPQVNAISYLVADIDTGDIYAEQGAQVQRPIASVTKLMTALVANEIISLDKKIPVQEGMLLQPHSDEATSSKTFLIGDLLYPLLMQSSNGVADTLADYYGKHGFVRWMNATAHALDMSSTTFADASGVSADNISTPEDLFRLAVYLTNKKSFVLKITRTDSKTITADDGTSYTIVNINTPANTNPFEGGKVGHTTAAEDTMLSVLSFKVEGVTRHIAVTVLGSSDQAQDTKQLADWIIAAAKVETPQAACAACTEEPGYRKIEI